jgi:hypothetical protein
MLGWIPACAGMTKVVEFAECRKALREAGPFKFDASSDQLYSAASAPRGIFCC